MNAPTTCSLTDVSEGCSVRVQQINGGEHLKSKLLSMGIIPDQNIVLVKKSGNHGPIVVRLNNTRIIIGHGMAEKISVTV